MEIASTEIIDSVPNKMDEILSNIDIDFDLSVKQQLISSIKEIHNIDIVDRR